MTTRTTDGNDYHFLEAIIADPDDDSHRLVYADWLEEAGQTDRAEFIRVQTERARLPAWDARQVTLELREQALLLKNGREWTRTLPKIEGVTWGAFRRGFVAEVTVPSWGDFVKNAQAWSAATPVETVTVNGWPQPDDGLETLEPVGGLRELRVTRRAYDADGAARLAAAPVLSTLRGLTVSRSVLGVEWFRRLVASPHLGNLKALRVPHNFIGNGAAGALLRAASLHSLDELDLSETAAHSRYTDDPVVDATGFGSLVSWPGMAKIRTLTLNGNNPGRAGLRSLLRSPRAAGLKKLVLRENGLNGSLVQELVEAADGLQLEELDLGHNVLRDLGPEYLARAGCLRGLKALTLDRCEIGPDGGRALARAPFLQSLRSLNVNQNRLRVNGVLSLLGKHPPELHTVQAADNDLDGDGAEDLARGPGTDGLLKLNLSLNEIGDRGAAALGATAHFTKLLVLWLKETGVTEPGAAALAQAPLGKRLSSLRIFGDVEFSF